jgi:hypothetical protein
VPLSPYPGITQRARMTSSLQIRATNAATQLQTRANLRTILPHGLWHFLQTGLSKSQLKIPSLTMPGHNPYVAYPHHVPPTPERVFFSTYGFSCPYILDRSSAERQCQLPTRQPRCAPQRPRRPIEHPLRHRPRQFKAFEERGRQCSLYPSNAFMRRPSQHDRCHHIYLLCALSPLGSFPTFFFLTQLPRTSMEYPFVSQP